LNAVAVDPARSPGREPPIVLVGPPNVGKSAIFGALTRTYVTVSNYPGTTVEIAAGSALIDGARASVLDTPGAHSFLPVSEEERVARDILLERRARAVAVIVDAKNLERGLLLAFQLAEMELPFVVCLNMMDEVESRGIVLDPEELARGLGVEVVPTVAIRRKGIARLRAALGSPGRSPVRVAYPEAIERAAARVVPLLPPAPIGPRALALMVLSGDTTLAEWLRGRVSAASLGAIEDARQELRRSFREPLSCVLNQARLREAGRLASRVVRRGRLDPAGNRLLARRLERLTIHPLWGVPVLAAVLYLAYLFVGVFGAGTLVDLLEEGLFGRWINPGATRLIERAVEWSFLRDLLVGPYGILTMALTYALALILPIVTTFFIAFGVLEDSGYLPRLAVLVNRAFNKLGLNGKAVLPMVLGLGCDTMATLTTRVLETPKERLIVTILLALGVPCSAQLSVILVLLGPLSPVALVVWLAVVLGVIVIVGAAAARVIPGRGSAFILELPPLRVPRLSNILVKTLARIEWYLEEAVPLFVLGTLVLFAVDRLGALGGLRRLAEPVVVGLLGLPRETAEAFLVGFLRRDFGAAGLYRLAEAGALDPVQIVVSVVTITLFMPCVANFFMILKERGWRTAVAVSAFILPFALGTGAALSLVLRSLGIPLGGG
jgi:ferrous iron transport protein B